MRALIKIISPAVFIGQLRLPNYSRVERKQYQPHNLLLKFNISYLT